MAAGTTGELAIEPLRWIVLARQNVQSSRSARHGVEFDVSAATGHARGDGHLAGAAGLGDDRSLLGVVQGIEHAVRDAGGVQALRQGLRIGDAVGAHQHRATGGAQRGHAHAHCGPARWLAVEHARRQCLATAGHVQRDAHHARTEDFVQLATRFEQRAAQAGHAPVALEEALKRDLGHGVGLGWRTEPLLERDHGVQAARPDAPGGNAPCDLVEQLDRAFAHHVVRITVAGMQRGQRHRDGLAPVARPLPGPTQPGRERGDAGLTGGVEHRAALGGQHREVSLLLELARQCQRLPQEGAARGLWHAARQDQRHVSLVEQDAVSLVEQRHAQPAHQRRRRGCAVQRGGHALGGLASAEGEAVAQEVEGEFARGRVDDVVGVGGAPRCVVATDLVGRQRYRAQSERSIERCQPLGVACGKVLVGCHHVHRHAGQRGHGSCQRQCEGLAFAGGHLGHALVEQCRRRELLRGARRLAECLRGAGGHDAQRLCDRGRHQAVPAQTPAHGEQGELALRDIQCRPGSGLGNCGIGRAPCLCQRRAQQVGSLRPAPRWRTVVGSAQWVRAPERAGPRQHAGDVDQHGSDLHGSELRIEAAQQVALQPLRELPRQR